MKRLASLALLGLLAAACGSTSGAEDLFSGGGTTGSGVTGATAGAGGATTGAGATTGSGSTSTGSNTTGAGGASTTTGSATTGSSTGAGMGGAGTTSSTSAASTTGSTTSSTTSTSVATSSSSGNPLSDIGCSDGTREYFKDLNQYPDIAGCAGGFFVAGVTTDASKVPQCNRMAGNDGQWPNGGDPNNNATQCSVEDLCAEGWHVCHGAGDVQSKNAAGCDPQVENNEFWLTRQVQNGQGFCAQPPSVNNLTGCGSLGNPTGQQAGWNCNPLSTWMNYQVCIPTQSWFCGNGQQNSPQAGFYNEAEIVVKIGPSEGGVLCCRD